MSSDDLLALLTSGRGIWMNNPGKHWQHRSYILLYSTADEAFFIAIVACDPDTNNASIVTVLTKEQYENDRGLIFERILARAMRSSFASKESVKEFCAEHNLVSRRKQRQSNFSILVEYKAASGVIDRAVLFHPPGHSSAEVTENERKIVDQPGFWEWFGHKVAAQNIPLENVLALKAARQGCVPVALTVS